MPIVAVIAGSKSDLDYISPIEDLFKDFEIEYEVRIFSAHRSPEQTVKYVRSLERRGVKVVIAVAGYAAHLPGIVAAHCTIPVIGVPIDSSSLSGLDALLSIVQMPAGVPVGTMTIGQPGARNAALYAISILSTRDRRLRKALKDYRKQLEDDIMKVNEEMLE